MAKKKRKIKSFTQYRFMENKDFPNIKDGGKKRIMKGKVESEERKKMKREVDRGRRQEEKEEYNYGEEEEENMKQMKLGVLVF